MPSLYFGRSHGQADEKQAEQQGPGPREPAQEGCEKQPKKVVKKQPKKVAKKQPMKKVLKKPASKLNAETLEGQ